MCKVVIIKLWILNNWNDIMINLSIESNFKVVVCIWKGAGPISTNPACVFNYEIGKSWKNCQKWKYYGGWNFIWGWVFIFYHFKCIEIINDVKIVFSTVMFTRTLISNHGKSQNQVFCCFWQRRVSAIRFF